MSQSKAAIDIAEQMIQDLYDSCNDSTIDYIRDYEDENDTVFADNDEHDLQMEISEILSDAISYIKSYQGILNV